MGHIALGSANTALANPATAEPIVRDSDSVTAALAAAGIQLSQPETTFMEAISWSDLQTAILTAYGEQKTPRLVTAEGSPGVQGPAADGTITLLGAVPPDAN